ncbi:MAG: DJ-1/PfpI family protein [Candidatus Thorarchaeota archaeon]
MRKRVGIYLILPLLLMLTVAPVDCVVSQEEFDVTDVSILCLIGTGFGWSYFEFEEIFESWGCGFVTTGETETVASCPNQPPRPVDVDILISEIDEVYLSDFDCIIVPSGGHWTELSNSEPVQNLICTAYDLGLYISGICIGVAPLACAGNILNGTLVTGHGFANFDVRQAGGSIDSIKRVIIDGQIITGGPGGGVGDGFEYAPHYDLCLNIIRAIMGDSYLVDVSTGTNPGGMLVYVSTNDHELLFGDVYSLDVEKITARIYPHDNSTAVVSYLLNATDVAGDYSGVIGDLEEDTYIIDLRIETNNRTLEVHRSVTSFDYTIPTTIPLQLELPLAVGAVSVTALIVILAIHRRR